MRLKHLIITLLTITLSSVFADTISAQQNFHFRKGWEYADIDWERSAFSEWERGMSAGEMSSTVMVAACYMREYGVGRNVSKGVSILENLAAKNAEVALFTANFWFPILDNDAFVNYKPHAGGQYNFWAMASWWKEPDLKSTTFGLKSDYAKAMKYAKMYLSKVSTPGYGRSLANDIVTYCYAHGVGGVNQDLKKALETYGDSPQFYKMATSMLKNTSSLAELEATMELIKPYIKNNRVLSIIDGKKEEDIRGVSAEQEIFVGYYIDRYKSDARSRLETWWAENAPLDNPDKFREAYKNENHIMRAEILYKFVNTIENCMQKHDSEPFLKLWEACYEVEEMKIQRGWQIQYLDDVTSYYYCDYKIKEIKNIEDEFDQIHQFILLRSDEIASEDQEKINKELANSLSIWGQQYENKLRNSKLPNSWMWNSANKIPVECVYYNVSYGSPLRDSGREHIIGTLNDLINVDNLVNRKDSLVVYGLKISDDIRAIEKNIKAGLTFINILQKEDSQQIEIDDYEKYIKAYPNAYYVQYCKDGYAMTTADTYTLDTPKEEIKTLLKSGISKGAAKYVKEHTKKSYLKTKSL